MVWAALTITILYLTFGTVFYGTRNSISKLALDWNKWLFTLYMVLETFLIVPCMFDLTSIGFQWLVFFIALGLLLTGAASIDNKDDLKYHYIGAALACLGSIGWLCVINPILLIVPVIAIACGDKSMIQWNGELGLMLSVYLALL